MSRTAREPTRQRAVTPIARRDALRAQQWLESGWLDVEFYGALRGRPFADASEAARDFVDHGMAERLSPHPSLHFVDVPPATRRAWRRGQVGRVLADLRRRGDSAGGDVPSASTGRETFRAELIALARRLARERTEGLSDAAPCVDWAAVDARARRPGRISVVVVARGARPTVRTVESVIETADDNDVEVLVLDCGSAPHVALGLHAALSGRPGLEVLRTSSAWGATAGTNAGVARSTGEIVLLLEPHVVLRRGALSALGSALEDRSIAGVQPVLLGRDDTIVSAGLVVADEGGAPTPVLVGHQADDARRLEGQALSAISPDAMALRTEDVVAVGGMDENATRRVATLDLCARLLRQRQGGFRVVPAARATCFVTADEGAEEAVPPAPHPGIPADPGLYDRIAFIVGSAADRAGDSGERQVVIGRRSTAAGQRRWSLKLPSVPGQRGDLWGDTHFGEALAQALRDVGEDVVTCRRGAHDAGPTHLDDVALAIRGLYPIPPTPGQVNVLWVISHPDDVDLRELDGYDLVFAASAPWSAVLAERSGREVRPLLQASEFAAPPVAAEHAGPPQDLMAVFVGSAGRGRERPLVRKALEAGVPLAVYGPGWDDLPDGVWRGPYVDNHRLPALYQRHGIVLADHWPDMARHGFIANRVFDAVASGARVICDEVVGVHDVFDPRDVVVVHDATDVSRAVTEMRRIPRADDHRRPSLTFRDRALALVAEVSRL